MAEREYEYRWASVPIREWPSTGDRAHVVRYGADTSLCNTTALPASIWRKSKRTPCVTCLLQMDKHDLRAKTAPL